MVVLKLYILQLVNYRYDVGTQLDPVYIYTGKIIILDKEYSTESDDF